jgi:hypothetical protein
MMALKLNPMQVVGIRTRRIWTNPYDFPLGSGIDEGVGY